MLLIEKNPHRVELVDVMPAAAAGTAERRAA
jgi:hypothetical protein